MYTVRTLKEKITMQNLSDLIWKENVFEVKLHCENCFDDEEYILIKEALLESTKTWKENGNIPVRDMVALMGLIDTLAADSRYYDEATAIKVEDARIEIQQIITSLLD